MVTIIDYGMGNIGSITNMIKRIGYSAEVSSDITQIQAATKIILPGVGHFDMAMQNIKKLGLFNIIRKKAIEDKTPILGICLGMQIMCKGSEEGTEEGLGLIDAEVKRFHFLAGLKLKVPHMGWNIVEPIKNYSLFTEMSEEKRFYFVHSYHVVCNDENDIAAATNYGYDFTSSFGRDNIMGVQFHPEKSHKFGMQLLKNFIEKY